MTVYAVTRWEDPVERNLGVLATVRSRRGSHIRIWQLAVREDRRRLGIGRKLLEFLTADRPGVQHIRVVVGVAEANLEAQKFLRACGYRCRRSVSRGRAGSVYLFYAKRQGVEP